MRAHTQPATAATAAGPGVVSLRQLARGVAEAGEGVGREVGGGRPPRAPEHVRAGRRMLDSHGRVIRDLRLSLTDRCNFRCVYCMEPDVRFAARGDLLTAEELVRVARVACGLGVTKIRLTGGEPTLRPELTSIIAGIRGASGESGAGRVEIAMITNGSGLTRERLREWKRAGLGRVTVSLDTLRPERFAAITRSGSSPDAVLAGVAMSLAEGLGPVKINAVLIRGVNDDEAAELAGLARRLGPGVEVRFIEFMPLDSGRAWDGGRWVSAAETRAAVERAWPLRACGDDEPWSTARTYAFADGVGGRVGFIAPVSSPFCGACARLRVTADGKVRPCLFSRREWDVRAVLRSGAGDEEVAGFLMDSAWAKQAGHGISAPGFTPPERSMSAIGG